MSRRCSDFSEDLIVLRFLSVSALMFISLLYQTTSPYCYKISRPIYLLFIPLSYKTLVAMNIVQPCEHNVFESVAVAKMVLSKRCNIKIS